MATSGDRRRDQRVLESALRESARRGASHYNPWHDLSRWRDVTLLWLADDDERKGLTNFHERSVSLRPGMTDAEARATLAHEVVHLERGPAQADHEDREEVLVEAVAALRLIPHGVLRLLPELLEKHGPASACDFLQVDARALNAGVEVVEFFRRKRPKLLTPGAS